eukprot:74990_1
MGQNSSTKSEYSESGMINITHEHHQTLVLGYMKQFAATKLIHNKSKMSHKIMLLVSLYCFADNNDTHSNNSNDENNSIQDLQNERELSIVDKICYEICDDLLLDINPNENISINHSNLGEKNHIRKECIIENKNNLRIGVGEDYTETDFILRGEGFWCSPEYSPEFPTPNTPNYISPTPNSYSV